MKTRADYPCFLEIDEETYHDASRRGEFLSSHKLLTFRRCPREYQMEMSGEIPPTDSAAFQLGRAAHCLICEGNAAFDERYLVSDGPVNAKTGEPFGKLTKAYKEWAAAQKTQPLSSTDYGYLTKLQKNVWVHPVATQLLMNGWAEGTVRARMCDEPVQIRVDYFNPNYFNPLTGEYGAIIDLKTTADIQFFESDARRFGYIVQLAFYREVIRLACGEELPVYIIAVEKNTPNRVGVWQISRDALDAAKTLIEKAIAFLKECRKNDTWPTGYEEARLLESF